LAGDWIQLPCERDDKGRVISFATNIAVKPTLFVTDECWRTFGARNWQHTAGGVLYYAAQHAKMSDRWLLVSQHTKQIGTALRQVAQDFWLVKNHANLSMGLFQRPALFTVSIYETAPSNGVGQEPMSTKMFRIDKAGVGSCYDTAAGTGIVGQSGADINQKRRGVPFVALILLSIAGFGVLIMSPKMIKAAAKKAFGFEEKQPGPVMAVPLSVIKTNEVAKLEPVSEHSKEEKPDEVTFLAMSLLSGKIQVFLSDGEEIIATSFRDMGSRVKIDGKEYKKKRPEQVEHVPQPYDYSLPNNEPPAPRISTHVFGSRVNNTLPKHQPLNPQASGAFDAR